MTDSHDFDHTVDVPSAPADSLDAGLAAGFGRAALGPRSNLDASQRPLLLRQAEGESDHVVKPKSDAMPTPEQAGTRYQLQGEIARGGMGAVLRGRDVDLGRDLAVKVLLDKYTDRPEVARRFLEEAQIGGQLQHPNVVPVYDVGRFGDRPFFTMKLVKGQTLAALLAERADPAQDRPRFLGIALQVCQALAYAHAKGVIHRDLKPANVMVGAFGEVQVMDWGLAKVLAAGGIADEEKASRERERPEGETTIRTARSSGTGDGTDTQAGSLLGTPAYMPPEQANGDVALLDRRADVFGLGAILCEILTGKPPYVGRSAEEVRRQAANGDLADTRARLDACGADAELVALTRSCLAPEAADRPKDAQAVTDALTAYLEGMQERLRRAELAEAEARARASEEAKRRRLALALAGTVLLALTLGGGTWLWLKAERDARQAQLTREINAALTQALALRERAKAERAGQARLLARAREQGQRALALVESGPADAALKAQVERLQAELDQEEKDRQLIAALDQTRLAQADKAAGQNRFASERAVPRFRKAFRAYGLAAGKGEPRAVAARLRGRPAAVREAVSAALDEWLDLATNPTFRISEPHLAWLRAVAAAAEPDERWARQFRAALEQEGRAKRRAALKKLARAADVAKLSPRALTRLAGRLVVVGEGASAVALLRRAHRQHPADFWINHDLAWALHHEKAPDLEEAVRYYTAAVVVRPDSPGAHINLGVALYHKGQLDEAIACQRQAIALDPKDALAHNNLGIALHAKGRLDEAIACYRKAIALDPKDAMAHSNLGLALKAKGRLDEAIACYRKAIALDPKLAATHINLGVALADKGQVDTAIACYRKAIALDPKDARFHTNLGNAFYHKGKLDRAIARYRRAIVLDPKYALAHTNLGGALAAQGRLGEAIAHCRKAIALDPKSAAAHFNLGNALRDKGRLDEAIARYRHAIALDPKKAEAHGALGKALLQKGQFLQARRATRRCLRLLSAGHPQRPLAARQLRQCRRLLALDRKLTAILQGKAQPTGPTEQLQLALLCQRYRQRNASAAGFYAAAFAAQPQFADDPRAGHQYNAACASALAGSGRGKDAGQLGAKEQARLRGQALTWLRADLKAWTKLLASGPPAALSAVRKALGHWQKDKDLAGIRHEAALANLPAEERKAWVQLWKDVAALRKKARP
jgi:serine/threonine-protein kinase